MTDLASETDHKDALKAVILGEVDQPVPDDIQILTAAIRNKIPGMKALIFYGSGLWKENPDKDTVYDFYVLVDTYRKTDKRLHAAALGYCLPPNVYYMEITAGGQSDKTLRCKYAVMRLDQFQKAARGKSLTPQIWARFSQPVRILYAKNETVKAKMVSSLADAVVSFHRKTLPLLDSNSTTFKDIWTKGFRETYAREWRSEAKDRGKTIYEAAQRAFNARTHHALPLTGLDVQETQDCITNRISRPKRLAAKFFSPVKRFTAKTVAFFRLLKALATFDGAVDYALYKIERQSGVRVEATDFQRRHPIIGIWPLLWTIYKKGGFR